MGRVLDGPLMDVILSNAQAVRREARAAKDLRVGMRYQDPSSRLVAEATSRVLGMTILE